MKTAALIGISRHRLTTDGEGVTTLVAFHGCPLRCKYCLNPQSFAQEGVWKQYDCEQLYEEVKIDEVLHSEVENRHCKVTLSVNSGDSAAPDGK